MKYICFLTQMKIILIYPGIISSWFCLDWNNAGWIFSSPYVQNVNPGKYFFKLISPLNWALETLLFASEFTQISALWLKCNRLLNVPQCTRVIQKPELFHWLETWIESFSTLCNIWKFSTSKHAVRKRVQWAPYNLQSPRNLFIFA